MSIMRRHAKVQCSRCKQIWTVPWGQDGIECNCHTWCEDGDKPSDCTWTRYNYTGSLGWPVGAHTNAENRGDDVLHRVGYCSTHKKYTYKDIPAMFQKVQNYSLKPHNDTNLILTNERLGEEEYLTQTLLFH